MMENTTLCWKCQALLNSQYPDGVAYKEQEWTGDEGKTLSRTLETSEDLHKTAQDGCLLCQRLLQAMGAPMRDALRRFRQKSLVYEHSIDLKAGQPGTLSMIVTSDKIAEQLVDGDEIKCFLNLFPISELADYLNHGVVEGCTDSNSTWALVSRWLAQCNGTHERCAAAIKDPKTLPSRVIDVTPGQPFRLLIVNQSTPPARYATLSHCWGSHMPPRLLSSNIATLQEEIPFSHLTKSFQDAITTCRRLDIHYLWIDSLCIIQDSEQDWQEQSAVMARVYSSSYCNIAAAHATDGTFGCFTTRNPASVRPLQLDLNWGPNPGSKYAVQNRYWWESVSEAPLNMRAWVFQERTLAPRNLLFGETEAGAGAVGLRGIRPHIDGPLIRKSFGLEADQSLDAFTVWGQLVARFSRGQLTHATDKLVALSAIASEMRTHIESEYLAGMWRKHLAYQLLWEVRGVQWLVRRGRPNRYVAPSWSWASVIGSIETACEVRFADDREIILEVLDAQVELVSNAHAFGQVKSGFLRVASYLGKGTVFMYTSKLEGKSFRLSINGDAVSTVIWDNEEEIASFVGQELYFLPIRYLPRREEVVRNGVSMGVPQVSGIILRQACSLKREYVRIGKFEDFGDPRKFQSACRQLAAQVDEREQEIQGWGPRIVPCPHHKARTSHAYSFEAYYAHFCSAKSPVEK
ncbi:hypothetical protein G7Y89_g10241 [Cudoniella acicularis]|uniref:Heterokaryon incompatibility domain-containing protein n=1 Tax=Cudoniella acicularis TaxID=354080 RepID=A0A8H4VZ90_9HELO|nr:hypothetical protein G7Y89_g10241 [Cudoniella acicularis]